MECPAVAISAGPCFQSDAHPNAWPRKCFLLNSTVFRRTSMKKTRLSVAVLVCALGGSSLVYGQTTQSKPAADNTKINKTEGVKTATADQQKQNRADLETTRQIRQLLTKDKALSTYAK